MKIAIPTRDDKVDEHFGHCQYFTVITLDDDKAVVSREVFTPPPACGCKSNLVETLGKMGVKLLLAGNMGEGAVMKLQQGGIDVVRGASGTVDAVLGAWIGGALRDNRIVCRAFDHECGHH